VIDLSGRNQSSITISCSLFHGFTLMRFTIPSMLIIASIVAPLSAGQDGPANPKVRREATESASPAPRSLSLNFPPSTIAQFRAICIDCHDTDGRGAAGREFAPEIPDFTNLRWQGLRPDQDLRHSILEGKGRSMPPMRAKIKPDDAVHLVELIRGFGGGRLVIPDQAESDNERSRPAAIPPNTVPGTEALNSRATTTTPRMNPETSRREAAGGFYRRSCRKCHGDEGKGDPLRSVVPAIPDFTNRHWQESRSKSQLAASILEGKNTHMPAFGSKLGTMKVEELVSYVRSFVPSYRDPIGSQSEDFEKRLDDLQREFGELRRAYRELSPPPSPK
jgi:mono/diheme cytochrome c family protein